MTKIFYGYEGWMCYDCRTLFPSFWIALKNYITGECCKNELA